MNKAKAGNSDAPRDNNPHPTAELNFTSPFELLEVPCCFRAGNRRQRNEQDYRQTAGRQYASRDAGTGRRRREILYQNHRFGPTVKRKT